MRQWCTRNVSVFLWKALIVRADKADRKDDASGKDLRPAFVTSISEVVGTDLWLDGVYLRGEVVDSTDQEPAQAKLEGEVRGGSFGITVLQ